ncbi:MAG: hypothetical protein R3D29_11040 [Nitratireductor sp.]
MPGRSWPEPFFCPTNADAQRSYSRTATSGKAQWIDAYYGWNNDCSFKTIDVSM